MADDGHTVNLGSAPVVDTRPHDLAGCRSRDGKDCYPDCGCHCHPRVQQLIKDAVIPLPDMPPPTFEPVVRTHSVHLAFVMGEPRAWLCTLCWTAWPIDEFHPRDSDHLGVPFALKAEPCIGRQPCGTPEGEQRG